MPIYSRAEQARLIAVWESTPWGRKAELARAEGFLLSTLSGNIRRWQRAGHGATCLRPGCPNPAPAGQQYCSRRCVGSIHRTPDHLTTPLDRFIYEKHRDLGMTRADFANLIGVSPQCLTNWFKGRCSPNEATYERIRQLFPDAPPAH